MQVQEETEYFRKVIEIDSKQTRSQRVEQIVEILERQGNFGMEKQYTQHGATTTYAHSIHVACVSIHFAEIFHMTTIDYYTLARGALLHDYFLYDWHERGCGHKLHGFSHPHTALVNANHDFALCDRERNIIARHMFPLTPIPPRCKEAWIVCITDKYCATTEAFRSLAFFLRHRARTGIVT